jgi:hypothetical protein
MKSKFTPGPWRLETGQTKIGDTEDYDEWAEVSAYHPSGDIRICNVDMDLTDEFQESEANARLIAAAPEMYAALKELWFFLREDDGAMVSAKFQEAINITKEAIAKAEGVTNAK